MNHKSNLLGISVDTLNKHDLPKLLFDLHDSYKKDHIPKYGTTINAYFFNHLYGWRLNSEINSELLRIIRNAQFVGLDSRFLCRSENVFGNCNFSSISGEDLFQAACAFLNENSFSLYILGGNEESSQSLLSYLRTYYPKIRVVGNATPLILTKGDRLEESQERDHFIVEAINKANPDVLLLQLGHPKQEIWFERVKPMLQVPLTLGMGGAIERHLTETFGEPSKSSFSKTSFKFLKHIPDYLKYAAWMIPLSLYATINKLISKLFFSKQPPTRRYFFLSSNKSLIVIPFPAIFTADLDKEMAKWLEDAIEQDYIVLDFSNLKDIDARGIALVSETIKWAENLGKKLFILNIPPDVRYLLKLSGNLHYFQLLEAKNPQEIIYRMSEAGKGPLHYLEFYESIYQEKNEVDLSFFGDFSTGEDYEHLMQKLIPILYQKDCVVDLKYCSYIDNKGIGFLLKLQRFQKANGSSFRMAGMNSAVLRQLRIAKVEHILG